VRPLLPANGGSRDEPVLDLVAVLVLLLPHAPSLVRVVERIFREIVVVVVAAPIFRDGAFGYFDTTDALLDASVLRS
jgi:hypothetical protein